ncbi:MAG TPA: YfhO family protein [Chitinophagaceae bacterium]
MNKFSWKPLIPHFVAVGVFLIVALIYCKPALEGKVLQQHDITQWKAMSKDIYDYKEVHGEAPLWTESMFSGMPGYMIATRANNVVPYYFQEVLSLFLPKPFKFFFLACICFYIFTLVLRVNPWIGIIGALGYAYATYNPVIIGAGHDTKMLSIALMPGLIAGLLLIYERRYWLGAGLTAAFAGSLISVNHLQITYYALIIAFLMSIGYAVRWIMTKQYKHMVIAFVFAVVAGLVGVLCNAVTLFTTYEYSKETIRGGSQLATDKSDVTKEGLSTDYALSYSVGIAEPLVMVFPRMYGGSSHRLEVAEDKSKAIEALRAMPPQLGQQIQNYLSFYWGGIAGVGTSGPPYAGAIICFLAILGFAVLGNKHKWWVLATMILTIMMSWGEYFLGFNTFLLEHLPFYNKFRAPSMILVVPTFLLCMMAVLALDKIMFRSPDRALLMKQFKNGLFGVAAVFAIALLMYMSFDYLTSRETEVLKMVSQEQEQVKEPVRSFFNALKEDRQSLFLNDILRSFFFMAVALVVIWMAMKRTLKPGLALLILGIFVLIDLLVIDAKYLNTENYQDREEYEGNFLPSKEDQQIMQDKGYYRVLDLRYGGIGGAFNQGAMTAYFHKSIGGYHPAKLSIYQDLIEKQLLNFPNCLPVLNMLNTKYIINSDGRTAQVIPNPDANGPAWFVKAIRWVNTPQQEMDALTTFNSKDTAVISTRFRDVAGKPFSFDSSAVIQLEKADNDIISYKTSAKQPQFAVFSEVYYDKGWKAYIDGKEVEIAKADYVLRALPVPAGEHRIEFRFDPASHRIGSTVTLICSILMIALLGYGLWRFYRNNETAVLEEY